MPAANSRPKQRTLIRWNDDLDKSLLLFMHHTCTELGIKVPYDEIGRRMGANFSEGAIVQHIAKLRTKMADLNVAPVPGPPKRGQGASRPSSVYTTKTRAGPPPAPPAVTPSGKGRRQRSDTARPTGVTKARAPRRGNGRRIKRSESDIEEEEEDEEMPEFDQSANPADGRRRRSNGQAMTGRRVSNVQQGAQHFNFPNYSFPNDHLAMPQASIEYNQAAYDDFPNYALAEGSVYDEEVEEDDDETLPLMALKATNQGHIQYGLQPPSPSNTSPKSRTQMAMPYHTANTTQSASPFTYNSVSQQQLPPSRAYSSSAFSNYDYSTYDTGSNGQTPASAFPAPVTSSIPGPVSSQSSSRNDSLASQTSPYSGPTTSHSPMQERTQSASMNQNSSPHTEQEVPFSTQGALLNQAITTLSEAQPMNYDWDYSNFHDTSQSFPDYSHGQADFPNEMNFDDKACEAFFQNGQAANTEYMDFSGGSQ